MPMLTSSWGMTETAPMALIHYEGGAESGMIGIPGPRLEARLLPVGDNRYELRVRGPNVMDGYFEEPEKNSETFDEEGFMKTGDAVRFANPAAPEKGLRFDGRIGEDFKLLSAVWYRQHGSACTSCRRLQALCRTLSSLAKIALISVFWCFQTRSWRAGRA